MGLRCKAHGVVRCMPGCGAGTLSSPALPTSQMPHWHWPVLCVVVEMGSRAGGVVRLSQRFVNLETLWINQNKVRGKHTLSVLRQHRWAASW